MKVEIDTNQDSPETIHAAIQILQAHLKSKGAQYAQQNIQHAPLYSYEDKLARKIERAKSKQEELNNQNTAQEIPVAMNIFDTPVSKEIKEEPEEKEDKIEILPY